MSQKARIIIFILILLVGAGVALYPTFSNLWNERLQARTIGTYEEAAAQLSDEQKTRLLEEAREFNAQHLRNDIVDAFDENNEYVLTHPYDKMLVVDGSDMMCYLEIPKITCKLAVYHGISAEVLEKGVGHLQGTSLPVGGESTHAVLSAHRGLPSAKLFTDLDSVAVGDQFYIHVLDEHLAYEVDEINTVLPEEVDLLDIVPGKDLVTLITCTPYGVNTHRLLVRGHRVPYVPPEEETKTLWEKMSELKFAILSLLAGLVLLAIVIIVYRKKRKKKDNDGEDQPIQKNTYLD